MRSFVDAPQRQAAEGLGSGQHGLPICADGRRKIRANPLPPTWPAAMTLSPGETSSRDDGHPPNGASTLVGLVVVESPRCPVVSVVL